MRFHRVSVGALLATSLFGVAALTSSPVLANNVVVVSPNHMDGWTADATGTANVQFVVGPGKPPDGVGSAQLSVGSNGDSRARLSTGRYGGVKLSDITELNYWTYVHSSGYATTPGDQCNPANGPGGERAAYIVLHVTNPVTEPPADDFLFFEPTYNGLFTCDSWYKWDALNGNWWTTTVTPPGEPFSAYVLTHPDSVIDNTSTLSPGGGVRVQAGVGAPDWNNFVGNTDAFTIGVNGNSTTYDFEPSPQCREADANGDFHGNHGDGDFNIDNDNCEETGHGGNGEGNDNVQSNNRGDGKDFQSTTIESTSFDTTANTMTVTGLGVSGGSPVAFTLVVLESGPLTPGFVSMTFSDGYTNAGNLLDGSVILH